VYIPKRQDPRMGRDRKKNFLMRASRKSFHDNNGKQFLLTMIFRWAKAWGKGEGLNNLYNCRAEGTCLTPNILSCRKKQHFADNSTHAGSGYSAWGGTSPPMRIGLKKRRLEIGALPYWGKRNTLAGLSIIDPRKRSSHESGQSVCHETFNNHSIVASRMVGVFLL